MAREPIEPPWPVIVDAEGVADVASAARTAQRVWAGDGGAFGRGWRARKRVLRRFRHRLARHGLELAEALAAAHPLRQTTGAGVAETLAAEVVPLADAARFLERCGAGLLRPERLSPFGRPMWLTPVRARVERVPHGLVLVIGPSNYPLMLPGVQALQALAAGNAVVLKPGRAGTTAARWLARLLAEAGLPPGLLTITDESLDAVHAWLADPPSDAPPAARARGGAFIDHAVLTGSADAGRAVLRRCAELVVPATVELSGSDAVFVLGSADVLMAADAIVYGLRLNGSATCIAPRRVLVERPAADLLLPVLVEAVKRAGAVTADARAAAHVAELVHEAVNAGAKLHTGGTEVATGDDGTVAVRPWVLSHVRPTMRLATSDLFAPVVSVIVGEREDDLLNADAACPFALGASVFGTPRDAERFARRINAGSVVINDLIVPTADARLPFGGAGLSGFGPTRGAEGLLAMTRPKAVCRRPGAFRPHYTAMGPRDAALFDAYLQSAHRRASVGRARAFVDLFRGLRATLKRDEASGGAAAGSTDVTDQNDDHPR